MPRPGAANGDVPKNGIGIAVWIAGVPGSADMREGGGAQSDRRGNQAIGNVRGAEYSLRHRHEHEERDEQADATIGDERTGEHDRESGAARPQLLRHEIGDRGHRAAIFHQLSEQGAQQEDREELRDKVRRAVHENLRPIGNHPAAGESGDQNRRRRGEQQDAPAPERQPDEEREGEQDAEKPDHVTRSRRSTSSGRILDRRSPLGPFRQMRRFDAFVENPGKVQLLRMPRSS